MATHPESNIQCHFPNKENSIKMLREKAHGDHAMQNV